jgi:type IV secretory pathway TrbF-like protein
MSKKANNWIILFLTSFLFALLIGNVVFYVGSDYLVPYIHLDLFTFVSLMGYGVIIFMVAFIVRRK